MRAVLAILAASLFSIANDGAIFKRGKDPHGKSMCACIGAAARSEMQKSDSCISGLECHSSQLGTIIAAARQCCSKERSVAATLASHPRPGPGPIGWTRDSYQATLKGLWPARACSRYGTDMGQ